MTDASTTELLAVRDVSRSFGGLKVLRKVSLSVAAGRITGLIGPNGAGKSTLFNILSGFLAPDTGEVVFKGNDITHHSVPQRSRAGLIRTFQTPQVFPHLSVHENLMLGSYLKTSSGVLQGLFGTRRANGELLQMSERAHAACLKFGLAGIEHELAGKLPAGQQRLVELTRAALAEPTLLCLDEPSSGLNTEEVGRLVAALRLLNSEGMALLLVSHDMDLMSIATEVNVLCFGEIISRGPFEALKSDARVREAYLGS